MSRENVDVEAIAGIKGQFPVFFLQLEDSLGRHGFYLDRFQKKQYSPIDVVDTGPKGFGLRARENLPKSVFSSHIELNLLSNAIHLGMLSSLSISARLLLIHRS